MRARAWWPWVLLLLALLAIGVIAGWFLARQWTASNATSASPPPTTSAVTPTASGDFSLLQLEAGMCIDRFAAAEAREFAVVDCAESHNAELFARVPVADVLPDAGDTRPSDAGLAEWAQLACQDSEVFDRDAAVELAEAEVVAAWPTAGHWEAGLRDFSCFVTAEEPWKGQFSE